MAKLTEKEIESFLAGYRKLCEQHQLYFVYDEAIWLQGAGELLDIDEAIEQVRENVERSNG